MARAMLAHGLKPGDRVAILSTPRLEFWVVLLATLRIGCIAVGMNPKYRLPELRYVVSDCQPRLLMSIAEFENRRYDAEVAELCRCCEGEVLAVCLDGTLEAATGFEAFLAGAEAVPQQRAARAGEDVQGSDPALIVYTSGSTGKPKGAVLSQYGLAHGASMQTSHLGLERQSIVVNFPVNHVACIADTCATTLVTGGKIVFQERFDPRETLQAVEAERCNMLGGVPTMLLMMLDEPDFARYDLSSVRLLAWGGAAMPIEGVRRLSEVCNRLMTLYGMTETSANILFGDQTFGLSALADTIGKPDDEVACRVVDESGVECETGVEGELQVSSGFFFLGYWQRDDATREAYTDDGWLRTGDLAVRRSDGCFVLKGRRSEMFKSGGYNVYPREIELALEAQSDVASAAVVGVPDPKFQEVGHAFVVPAPGSCPTADALRAACRTRLANYKVPKTITIVDALPMLPVGKVDKPELKRIARRSLGLAT
jgi:acyl-CoA synthetase (AMP-forming)/AMP-acid ligase II